MNDFLINAIVAQDLGNVRRLQALDGIDVDAAVVADAILMGTAYWAVTYEQELLQVITPEVMLIVCASVLVFGMVITWLCAYISINKYLRMRANTLYYI